MLELAMIVAVVIIIAKLADMDDKSPWLWGGIALGLCVLTFFFVPWLPLLRIAGAGVLTFVLMTLSNMVAK